MTLDDKDRIQYAILIENGHILESCTERSTAFFRKHPMLMEAARDFADSRKNFARYIWIEEHDWFELVLAREPGDARHVSVSAEAIDPPFSLTPRELDVLTLLAFGLSNPQIADTLDIGTRTATKHVENIFAKTNCWTRAGAAGLAVDKGILRIPLPGSGMPRDTAGDRISDRGDTPAKTVNVGFFPQSGIAGDLQKGAEVAIREINAGGGIFGRPVMLTPLATGTSQARFGERLASAAAEKGIDALLSSGADIPTGAASISTFLSCPVLVDRLNTKTAAETNVFQMRPRLSAYVCALRWLLKNFPDSHQENLVVVGDENLLEDYRLNASPSLAPDILSPARPLPVEGRKREGWRNAARRISGMRDTMAILATEDEADVAAFLGELEPASDQVTIVSFAQPVETALPVGLRWITISLQPDTDDVSFPSRFKALFKTSPPSPLAMMGYDAIHLLADAWRRIGSPADHPAIADDLRSVIYRGLAGSYHFGTPDQQVRSYPFEISDPSLGLWSAILQHGPDRPPGIVPSRQSARKLHPVARANEV